ncbi:MAG: glycine--tRNA ligase subunit alpha, partial [Pseudomonadota bacterium]
MPFNDPQCPIPLSYGDVFREAEAQYARWNFDVADTAMLMRHYEDAEVECRASLRPPAPATKNRPPRRNAPSR